MTKVKKSNFLHAVWKPCISISATLVIGWMLLHISGYDALEGGRALVQASFKNFRTFCDMLNKTTPLLLCGLGIAISFQGSIFNLGSEGQFYAGALCATLVGIYANVLPGWMIIFLMIVAGAIGGALWGGLAGFLKAKLKISELVSTIMLNYIMLRFVSFIIRGPIYDRTAGNQQSFPIVDKAYMRDLIPGTRFHSGYLISVVIALIIFILLYRTYYGYEVRAVGYNSRAAEIAGIKVERTTIYTMLVSGALAGIAGCIEICQTSHYLTDTLSPGYGWTGIAVSVLASHNPLGILITSLLFGFLSMGATAMQRAADISSSFADVLKGLIIFAVAITITFKSGDKIKSIGRNK